MTVRFGVVGTSFWTDFLHLPMLTSHPQAAITAICGRTRTNAEALAAKYSIPRVFTDYRTMIAAGGLDAVLVATPDDTHLPIVMAALDAGLHVVCEKPLACSAADARAMYERAEAAAVNHMTFFTWRWLPYLRHMRVLLDRGRVGQLYHCSLHYIGDYGRNGEYNWRFDRGRANGILGDLGSHMIDLARWLVGDIVRVSAHLATHASRVDPDGALLDSANDAAHLLVEFASGAHGMIEVSSVGVVGARFMEQRVALHGASGSLNATIAFGGASQLDGVGNDGLPLEDIAIPTELWGTVDASRPLTEVGVALFCQQPVGTRLFVDDILAGRRSSPSFYDGWKAQEIVDAAMRSHERSAWVEVR
jgi:predicted dehydrogenase